MSARKFLPLFLATLSLTILAGCGGNNQSAGLPQGNFTNSNLSGTYAFAFSGTNFATGAFFTMAGSLQANGSGTITGGTIDINIPGSAVPLVTNASLTGTYIVHADGRGSATLTPAGSNHVNIDFVLLSSQHGAVIRFDTFGTASGSLDMQSSSAFNLAALAGSNFAFNVGGTDSGGAPQDSAGVFAVDASGNLISGVQDTSDNGAVTQNEALTAAPAAMTAPSGGNGRGLLTISSATLAARHYAYYVVSANQIRLIEIDSAPVLAGDALRQTSTSITGPFAFTASGSVGGAPFVVGGILNVDSAGNVSNSVEDTNTIGSTPNPNVALSGAFSVVTNGRSTLSLNSGTINYAVYPSSGGLQLLRTDSNFVVSGTAFQQSGSFSNSTINGRYGANITGVVLVNGVSLLPFDAVYQLTANGAGQLTGAQDVNSAGTLAANLALRGTYALGSDGRASAVGTLNTSAGNLGVIYYAVDSTHILFIQFDPNAVAVGAFSQQQ